MVDPLPSNQTTSPWSPSLRRTWQTHQPNCSTCYCGSRAMTTFSVTTPTQHPLLLQSMSWTWHLRILPFIMVSCPQAGRKHSNRPLWVKQRCMPLLTSSLPVGWMKSRRFLVPYILTGNIVTPSLLKMALSSVQKPSLFLLQKGREYYSNYTSSTQESPNPSCSHVDVFSGPV